MEAQDGCWKLLTVYKGSWRGFKSRSYNKDCIVLRPYLGNPSVGFESFTRPRSCAGSPSAPLFSEKQQWMRRKGRDVLKMVTHTHIYIYIDMYTYTACVLKRRKHVCMYACTHVRMYACMHVCTCVYMYVHIYIYMYMVGPGGVSLDSHSRTRQERSATRHPWISMALPVPRPPVLPLRPHCGLEHVVPRRAWNMLFPETTGKFSPRPPPPPVLVRFQSPPPPPVEPFGISHQQVCCPL